MVGRLVNLGALRRNPNRPASVRTVANYRDCLLQVARRIAGDGLELRDLTAESAVDYLAGRTGDLGQKALDMHRQALQAMLVHVSRRLPEGERLTVVRSLKPGRKGGRAYTPQQVRMVAAAQRERNALSTLLVHAAGLRAHELFTLARPDEQPPDRRPARPEKFAGRPGRDYTVVGKGGLVRLVRVPDHLADRLEAQRRDEPVRVTGPRHPLHLALRRRRRHRLGRQLHRGRRSARSAGPAAPTACAIIPDAGLFRSGSRPTAKAPGFQCHRAPVVVEFPE